MHVFFLNMPIWLSLSIVPTKCMPYIIPPIALSGIYTLPLHSAHWLCFGSDAIPDLKTADDNDYS